MTRARLAPLSLFAALALSLPADAQEGFSWGHHIDVAADPARSRITLVHGVPETDNVQFFARCEIGPRGPEAVAQIWADTAGLANGTPVRLGITDGAGAGAFLDGTITGVNAEFGITGVEMVLPLENPLFGLMRVRDVISYAIDEGTGMEIAAAGIGPHLDAFVTACSATATRGVEAPTAAIRPGCDRLGAVRARDGVQPQRVTFTNATDGFRGVVWIDYEGGFIDMGGLGPGERMTIDSCVTHPFMITDGPGNCLEVMATAAGQDVFRVTAPGKAFGGE